MDWLQFISSIIAALAWPFVVVVLLLVFRQQLAPLFNRIQEFTLPGGATAKFRDQLESSREKAEEVASETPKTAGEKRAAPDEAFLELARNFPEAAVSQAWKQIEEVLLQIRERLPTAQTRQNLNSVVRRLREQQLIDGATEELFLRLRQARNTAVHAGDKTVITPGEALEFREQARILVEVFQNVLAKMPAKQD